MSLKHQFLAAFLLLAGVWLALRWTVEPALSAGVVELTWATDENPYRREQIRMFEEWHRRKYGREVRLKLDVANYNQAKIVVQSIAGAGPDLFDFFGPVQMEAFRQSGIMLDVTEAAKQRGFDVGRFWPALASTLESGGRQYAVPDNAVTKLLLVNLDVAEKAGVTLPTEGCTWPELVDLASRLTIRTGSQVQCFGILELDWMELVLGNGGRFLNEDGTRCLLDSPETTEALTFYSDLIFKHRVLPSPADLASMSSRGGFGAGNLNLFVAERGAMLQFGRYAYMAIEQINAENARLGRAPLRVMPLPPLRGKRSGIMAAARCTSVNAKSQHTEEALHFLEFLASEEFNRYINATSDALNCVVEYAKGPDGISGGRAPLPGADDPAWVTSMEQAQGLPYSPYVAGDLFNRILQMELERMLNRLQSPADTARRMQEQINAEIQRFMILHPELRR